MKEAESITYLEKKMKDDAGSSLDTDATIQMAIGALQNVLAEDVKAADIEVATCTESDNSFKILTNAQVDDHLTAISEKD